MNQARVWRLCAILGGPAIAAFLAVGASHGLSDCRPPDGLDPVLAIEFAADRIKADAILLYGNCRSGQLTALARDSFAFVPLYMLFVVAAAWAAGAWRAKDRPLAYAAILAITAAAAFDLFENNTLDAVIRGGGDFTLLALAVRAKFGLIAIAEILIGVLLLRHRDPVRLAGYAVVVAGGATLILLPLGVPGAMIKPMALGLVLPLLVALAVAIRPALADRPEPA
jgi:hypothetical protein